MKECSGVERPLQIWCAPCLLEVDDDVIYACWALNRPDDGGILCLFWNVFSASEELVLWTHMQPPDWEKVSFHQLIFTVIVLWVALDFGPPSRTQGFVSVQRCLRSLERFGNRKFGFVLMFGSLPQVFFPGFCSCWVLMILSLHFIFWQGLASPFVQVFRDGDHLSPEHQKQWIPSSEFQFLWLVCPHNKDDNVPKHCFKTKQSLHLVASFTLGTPDP